MSWGEWLGLGVSVVSVLGVWLTAIAWWHGRSTNQLIKTTSDGTQALITALHAGTQQTMQQMDSHWREAFERMDQRADERHRETLQAIQALKS